jgi:hypothetical protein
MDRGKENPRLDGVSALLVVSFRVRRFLLSPVCLGGLVLPSSNFEVFHSGFCASSDGVLKLAEVSLRLLLQHPLLARTRHCRSGFGFRSHGRRRHCRSDIDLDVAMGIAIFSVNNWMLGIEFP